MESQRIADLLRRAAEGESWHGPSLRELLMDVDAGRAATRAIPGAHTIWELVLHVTAWRDAVRRRLTTGEPVQLPEAQSWPEMPEPGEQAWRDALRRLDEAGRALREAVESLPSERLDQPISRGGESAYLNLHGVVHHDLYHAGQVAILRRALGMGLQV